VQTLSFNAFHTITYDMSFLCIHTGGSADKALRRSSRLANGHKPAIINTAVSVAVDIAIAAVGNASTSVKSNGMDIAKEPLAQAVAFNECMTGSNDVYHLGAVPQLLKRKEQACNSAFFVVQLTFVVVHTACQHAYQFSLCVAAAQYVLHDLCCAM
jgi:hypothetical protein